MTLADGYHDVPRGKVATVVTFLEMRRKPDILDIAPTDGWRLKRHDAPDRDWYLRLFRAVGNDWLWFGRTILAADALDEILQNPKVHVFSLHKDGKEGGLLELDFRQPGQCELAYFGLIPKLIGTGAGRYLMTCALDAAWRQPITRFHLHTCTMDSPQALSFYRRTGFVPYDQKVEIYDDPRVHMGYDRALAPHLPIYDP
ncbi:MAG: GNAT family N-acetyltransferase [Pseudomonadota bacterium]